MSDILIKYHCVKQYIRRIKKSLSYYKAKKEIKELLKQSVLATPEETHFIRYSRRKLSKYTDNTSKYFIYNKEIAFVELDNSILTCFECLYIKNMQNIRTEQKTPNKELEPKPIKQPPKKKLKIIIDDTIDKEFEFKIATNYLKGKKILYNNKELKIAFLIFINNWTMQTDDIKSIEKIGISIDNLTQYKLSILIYNENKSTYKSIYRYNYKKSLFVFV